MNSETTKLKQVLEQELTASCGAVAFSNDVLWAVQSSVFHAADSQYKASHSFCTEGITVTCVREG
jgi:hypothetical protein